ncbi:hypothetical protein DV702_08855 [Sporosarcina sp. PTS2304]|uniref:hypothetical protein n=1 Tax=Sporosarcina sp. PTS2304 TaxID=2283194 RepID=UPI000E0DFEC4|nr:hypothetical protein [Sporosarcina sp. PTS2304]AXH99835.1 hypothetical protein DV702_08855 [Sporosarcina sp. PTS2304]
MLKKLTITFALFSLLILSGCSSIAKYGNEEPAAIVNGEVITVYDLRLLFPDEKALSYLDGAIQMELAKQEVEKMGLDISKHLEEEEDWFSILPPEDADDENTKQIRDFAKSQAKKLNMTPEEFQRAYAKKLNEQNAYLLTYLEKKLGPYEYDSETGTADYNEKANRLLEELAEQHKDEIEVLIN